MLVYVLLGVDIVLHQQEVKMYVLASSLFVCLEDHTSQLAIIYCSSEAITKVYLLTRRMI